jgi:type II secretory pathway predicted ATPase ExeA
MRYNSGEYQTKSWALDPNKENCPCQDEWLLNQLDKSQSDALRYAFTHKVALIIGPPGTGKSFLGRTILKTLVENFHLIQRPIILLGHKNQSLDDFLLAYILDFEFKNTMPADVFRVGNRSKSEFLNERFKFKHDY